MRPMGLRPALEIDAAELDAAAEHEGEVALHVQALDGSDEAEDIPREIAAVAEADDAQRPIPPSGE